MTERELLQRQLKNTHGQYRKKDMRKFRDTFFALIFTLGFILLAELLVVNWALNCQTWDKSYWDETNSCLTIPQMFGFR